jgi:hypothetical protein
MPYRRLKSKMDGNNRLHFDGNNRLRMKPSQMQGNDALVSEDGDCCADCRWSSRRRCLGENAKGALPNTGHDLVVQREPACVRKGADGIVIGLVKSGTVTGLPCAFVGKFAGITVIS